MYAQRARQNGVTGNEIQVSDEMFTKIRETIIEAASWKEMCEYQDADEECRLHDTPRIYSDMPLGVFLHD
jgi:hypothetical protein